MNVFMSTGNTGVVVVVVVVVIVVVTSTHFHLWLSSSLQSFRRSCPPPVFVRQYPRYFDMK